MLSGVRIRDSLQRGTLSFTGQVRGNGLLLSLGSHLLEFAHITQCVEPWQETSVTQGYERQQDAWEHYELGSGNCLLIAAQEHLALPPHIGGAIGTLSHMARLGLFAHFASPFVAPGYQGYLALELLNVSPNRIRLRPGLPVAKVILFLTDGTDPEAGEGSIPFWYSSTADEQVDLRSRFPDEFGDVLLGPTNA